MFHFELSYNANFLLILGMSAHCPGVGHVNQSHAPQLQEAKSVEQHNSQPTTVFIVQSLQMKVPQ